MDSHRKWITGFNVAIYFLTRHSLKWQIGFPGGQEAQDGGGKEDETNFLPLPEIRIPGIVYSAPFQVQGQTQY